MLLWARNQIVGLGFKSWIVSVRFLRVLRQLGRPRLAGLEHITLPVTDLARARAFYCDVLGAVHFMTIDAEGLKRFGRPPAPNDGEGAYHVSVYLGGATRVDLFLQSEGQPKPALGHPHYAFAIPARDMLKWRRRLAAAGVPIDGPLQLGPPGQASIYFNDPFGNHLEITCFGFARAVEHRPPRTETLSWGL